MLNVLNLGAGVQSSALALMAAAGEIGPMPDCAVFADTGAEPERVYRWVDQLERLLPFPVYRVMAGSGLLANLMSSGGGGFVSVPFYTDSHNGGMTRRQCTRQFKIDPIRAKVRELLGLAKGKHAPREVVVTQWIGISTDEACRAKPARDAWAVHRFPLLEAGFSRGHCLGWMLRNGFPEPVKSSCSFCPYHSNEQWRDLKLNDAEAFAQAVSVDAHLRSGGSNVSRGMGGNLFLHRRLVPLDQVDLRNAADHGQMDMFDQFDHECEGLCGV